MKKYITSFCFGLLFGVPLTFGVIFASVADTGQINLFYLLAFDIAAFLVYIGFSLLLGLAFKRLKQESYTLPTLMWSLLSFTLGYLFIGILLGLYIASSFWKGSL